MSGRTGSSTLSDDAALGLADVADADLPSLLEAAASVRDRRWGRRITYSPKVFLPVTNLCRDRCDYCSFRRSPGEAGEWTMSPADIGDWVTRGREQGCAEALLCLGDRPETAFGAYRRTLAGWGHSSTVDYLEWTARAALERGLLPHTNAGVLSYAEMARLKEVNVSLGLMLENLAARLCGKGMPHHLAPDKRPDGRLRMIEEAGRLRIPFTTGILVGIGETRRERVEALLAIRRIHREYGHIQEIIVQTFRAHPTTMMRDATEASEGEVAHAIAVARLVLDADVAIQAPPNLNASSIDVLLRAGVNDFGGISPVTPDYINSRHAWPHVERLAEACRTAGFELVPRLAVYDAFLARDGFLAEGLRGATVAAQERLGAQGAA